MNWSDQDIDKLFQQTPQAEIPPFQDGFWTEMEAMLPEQKRKKVAVWWWAGGTAVVAALVIFGLFIGRSEAIEKNHSAKASANKETNEDSGHTADGKDHKSETSIVHGATANSGEVNYTLPSLNLVHGLKVQKVSQTDKVDNTSANSERSMANTSVSVSVVDKPLNELPKLNLVFTPLTFHPEMPQKEEYKPTRFYVQAGAGLGFSARKNVPQSSDILHCYTLGGGLYKKIDNVILTLGLQGRVDFVRNIRYTYFPDGTGAKRIDADYHQLYSLEMPASIGVVKGRNTFAINVNAGFQAGVFGELKETNNNVLVRSENTFVRVDNKATTLTMELGLSYLRTISPDWYLGAGLNTDIIGPFNGSSYAGQERTLPVNAQVMLRKTF